MRLSVVPVSVLMTMACSGLLGTARSGEAGVPTASLRTCGLPGRPEPSLLQLSAPPGPTRALFEMRSFEETVERVTRQIAEAIRPCTVGTWSSETLSAADAVGPFGQVDPWKLTELFGARRVTVRRAPLSEGNRVTRSLTLISPYPDANLTHILPGTLLIAVALPSSPPSGSERPAITPRVTAR
jgi:hypothetical protein